MSVVSGQGGCLEEWHGARMSIKVMTTVWDHAPVDGTELLLLLAMADYAHDDGSNVFPSVATLAKRVRLKERQTQIVLASLRDKGLIERCEKRHNGPWVYQIRLDLIDPLLKEGVQKHAPVQGVQQDAPRGAAQYTPGVQKNAPLGVQQDAPITVSREPSVKPSTEPSPPPGPPQGGAPESSRVREGKATKISPDWHLTPRLYDYAITCGMSPDAVEPFADEFKKWWLGAGGKKLDWDLTFMARCRNRTMPPLTQAQPNGSVTGSKRLTTPDDIRHYRETHLSQERRA